MADEHAGGIYLLDRDSRPVWVIASSAGFRGQTELTLSRKGIAGD
jgi:hypothetical protein